MVNERHDMVKVSDIVKILEQIAPPPLAEEWDNVGLQVGHPDRPAGHVFVALDPTPEVIDAACSAGADLLVTHHPLIFRALKSVNPATPTGAAIETAIKNGLAIYAAHTNLDSAVGGVNDVLAEKIGLSQLRVLSPQEGAGEFKLVFFVPVDHTPAMMAQLSDLPIGVIGAYSNCSFRVAGTGAFMADESARPYIGKAGEITETPEFRVEMRVRRRDLLHVIDQIRAHHPYETLAYDVYPLMAGETDTGIGRIGELKSPCSLAELARDVKLKMGVNALKFSGPPELTVKTAAVCSGSGSGLLKAFLASDAQVLITGDLRYHDAVDMTILGRGLIDVGHFPSEHIVVPVLKEKIDKAAAEAGLSVRVTAWDGESDPFVYV